jgi:chemotaxis response regulator CheB
MGDQNIRIGGSVGSGNVFGHGSKVKYDHTTADGRADQIQQLLDELSAQIRNHQSELDNLQELNESLEAVREELAKPEPQKSFVAVALRGIAASAGGVTAVAEAARNVLQLFK